MPAAVPPAGPLAALRGLLSLHRRARALRMGAVAALLALGTADLALAVGVPLLWARIIDALIAGDGARFRADVIVLGVVILIRPMAGLAIAVVGARTTEGVAHAFREAAAARVFALPFRAQEQLQVGDVLSRAVNDTNALKAAIPGVAIQAVFDAITVVVVFALLLNMHAGLALALVATLPLTVIYRRATAERVQGATKDAREAIATATNVLQGWFQRAPLVRLHRIEAEAAARCAEASAGMRLAAVRAAVIVSIIEAFNAALVNAPTLLVFAYGGWLTLAGQLSVGGLVAFLSLASFFHTPVQRLLSATFTVLPGLYPVADRVRELLSGDVEAPRSAGTPAIRLVVEAAELTLQTPGRQPFHLAVPGFTAAVGEVVGIVGSNGSGKTTFAKLLAGLYAAEGGAVGGADAAGHESGPPRVDLAPQRPAWFDGSLLENVTLFAAAPDRARADATIDEVGLRPIAASWPAGVDQRVDAAAAGQLSGGELQRLGLARALYGHAGIVILDEPSSGLDPAMRRDLPAILARHRTTRGFIVITHSESLTAICDRVYRIESSADGQVVTPLATPSLVTP
jgi:ATP-binding cassette subfamily C protein